MGESSLNPSDVSRDATKLAELVVLGKMPAAKELIQKASAEERAALLAQFKDYDDKASLKVRELLGEKLVAPKKPEIALEDAALLRAQQTQSVMITPASEKLGTLTSPPRPVDFGELRGDMVVFKATATADPTPRLVSNETYSISVTDTAPPAKGPSIFSRIGGFASTALSSFQAALNATLPVGRSSQTAAQTTTTSKPEVEAAAPKDLRADVPSAGVGVKPAYFLPPQQIISFVSQAVNIANEIVREEGKKPAKVEDIRSEISRITGGISGNLDPMQLDALSGELSKLSAHAAGDPKVMAAIKDAKLKIQELRSKHVKRQFPVDA